MIPVLEFINQIEYDKNGKSKEIEESACMGNSGHFRKRVPEMSLKLNLTLYGLPSIPLFQTTYHIYNQIKINL